MDFSNPILAVFNFVALVIAITIHEFSHAYAADRLGDPTPSLQGRLTLNPLKHLDPLGTVLILIAGFGWGKPVIFDPFNLRNPRRDAALISLAGPASNIVVAIVFSILLRIAFLFSINIFVVSFLVTVIEFNLILAVFNLIPVAPLDGFKIVGGFLSPKQAKEWYALERFGIFFLIFLLLPLGGISPISRILSPILNLLFPLFVPNLPIT